MRSMMPTGCHELDHDSADPTKSDGEQVSRFSFNDPDPPPRLSDELSLRLLRDAAGSATQAWAALTAHLRGPQGAAWSQQYFHSWFGQGIDGLLECADDRSAVISRSALNEVKERAKHTIMSATDSHSQAVGWLGYSTSVALGLTLYHERLSTMPPEAWIECLTDVGTLLPHPWSGVFEDAVGALEED